MKILEEIRLEYYYLELNRLFKELMGKNWLSETDLIIISKEINDIKELHHKLNKQFVFEEASELIDRMKKMPLDSSKVNKEKFKMRLEEWGKDITKHQNFQY